MPKPTLSQDAVLKAAKKKLPVKSTKALNDILDFAADDKAEAYRIGVEEAQAEILASLTALPTQQG